MPMLARLQGALGCTNLTEQMVLLPKRVSNREIQELQQDDSDSVINLVVGYDSSPKSQTALDLTLCIAHQTRLATRKQVVVQVVYVVNNLTTSSSDRHRSLAFQPYSNSDIEPASRRAKASSQRSRSAIAQPTATLKNSRTSRTSDGIAAQFEQADRILWQARCLADEWRGSLNTHLRFGRVAEELRHVVEEESAALLLLGCESSDHRLVHELGAYFPCPVLGIPSSLQAD